jgi:hypothetical protein
MTTLFSWFWSTFTGIAFIFLASFNNSLFAAVSSQYCGTTQNYINLSVEKLQDAALDDGTKVGFTQRDLTSGLVVNHSKEQSVAIDFNFQYTIVDFDDSITPMTNGHLHNWNFPVSNHRKGSDHSLDYYLTPVISVSSNGLKDPELLDHEALQLWAGATYRKDFSEKSVWLIGFRSDHRFGDYRVYPVAGICWQPNQEWHLQLALPDFSISRYFSSGINIKLFAGPEGNRWHVFSADTTISSDFIYNTIISGISVEWQVNPTVSFALEAIQHSAREFSFALDDGTPVETNAQSSTGFLVSLGLLF